jgi:vacuolar-type H+-ATPase catalytic subunit A/Vma1
MNNFVFSQDPLLFQSFIPGHQNNFQESSDLKQQYDAMIAQYQSMQQKTNQQTKDYLGELDTLTRDIDPDIIERLTNDEDYNKINAELQFLIQEEMLKSVKWKINNNPNAVTKIDKLKEIILIAKKEKNDENNRNLMELNDYIKNYSDLTFDEYKQLKKITTNK